MTIRARIPYRFFVTLLIAILAGNLMRAQQNHLKKRLTYEAADEALSVVLTDLEELGKFYFSYDSEILDPEKRIKVKAEKLMLQDILSVVLPSGVNYRAVGRHVVLYVDPEKEPSEVIIKGRILDRSASPILYASVYNPEFNTMAASDATGYFELSMKRSSERITLVVSRSGYETHILHHSLDDQDELEVSLKEVESEITGLETKKPEAYSVNERGMVKVFVPEKLMGLSENDPVYTTNPVQISLVPGISTNGLMNFNSVNLLSINILAGYSRATEGFEVGGLVNIDREYVNGLQIAGLANVTGDSLKGLQIAGLSNFNGNKLTGFQVAGFSNTNMGDLMGIQIAGFANTLGGHMYGSQVSGFGNFTTQSVDGFQLSGFANYSMKDVALAQLSGFGNYATNNYGIQGAGFMNITMDKVNLGQLAGFMNYARINNGFQLSGFFNYAHESHGLQLSFVNYADTSSGLPIGFLSYVRSGYHVLELAADEHFPLNLAFKTGVPAFYNIFESGSDGEDLKLSYGLGSLIQVAPKWQVNFDLIFGTLLELNTLLDQAPYRYLLRFEPAINFQVASKFGIAVGPALRIYGAETVGTESPERFSNYWFYEAQYDNWYVQYWLGGKLALRFF